MKDDDFSNALKAFCSYFEALNKIKMGFKSLLNILLTMKTSKANMSFLAFLLLLLRFIGALNVRLYINYFTYFCTKSFSTNRLVYPAFIMIAKRSIVSG